MKFALDFHSGNQNDITNADQRGIRGKPRGPKLRRKEETSECCTIMMKEHSSLKMVVTTGLIPMNKLQLLGSTLLMILCAWL